MFDSVPSLTITAHDDGRRIVMVNAQGATASFQLMGNDVVRQQTASLAGHLAVFRGGFDSVPESTVVAAAYRLNEVAKVARNFLAIVLDGGFSDLDRLIEFVGVSCPRWTDSSSPPILHIVNPLPYHLPWEIFPLFRWRGRVNASTVGELADQARMFLGFGARIERQFSDAVGMEATLDAHEYLPIRFLYDAALDGAHEELSYLRSKEPWVRVDGPFPQKPVASSAEPTVGQQLRDPTVMTDGSRRDRPDQIVHFSCHCDASVENPWEDFGLRLSGDDDEARPLLTLAVLMHDLLMAEDWPDADRDRRMPLVFLNACGSSVMDPRAAVSMMTPFVKNANRGVIGTAASVPDRVAAQFSRWFYAKLLSGQTVADVLYAARQDLLVTYANPLGLLYTHYGHPRLRVHPVLG